MMTVTKIVLEKGRTHLQLRVFSPDTASGSTVIESVRYANGLSPRVATLYKVRKRGAQYARRFGIPFEDQTLHLNVSRRTGDTEPMPWCERCKCFHHATADHIKTARRARRE